MSEARILLVVGGGIAAYKACELVRLIRKGGADVTCVLTAGGAQFVTPMSLAALSGNQVHTSLWDLKNEAEIGHIELSREADLVVVCPATADLLAKMSAGIADDLGTTMILATNKPVLAVPAMNVKMWEHEATQRNVAWLRNAGVKVLDPDIGTMACGEIGPGRLPEPELVWLEIAETLGIDPGEAGDAEITAYLEGVEPEADVADGEEAKPSGGGLGAMLSSLIARTTPHRIAEDEVEYPDLDELSPEELEALREAGLLDGDDYVGPPLPEPDPDFNGSVLARKGDAKAAPPTDREAINHLVNERQSAPQPFEGEDAAVPTGLAPPELSPAAKADRAGAVVIGAPAWDPLAGQPLFEEPIEKRPLFGKHVLVTAGPTHEAIDPVRYLANRSSGKQGFAIAAAAAAAGAKVTLVSGPVNLETPIGVERVDVESAREMSDAVKQALPADCAIMVAAVADWRPRDFHEAKIKKRGSAPPALMLTENPDILAMVAASAERPDLLIGFAAETNDVVDNARKKRKSKGVDWIVANDVSGDTMGGADNQVHIVREKTVDAWEAMTKQDVAWKLVTMIAEQLSEHA